MKKLIFIQTTTPDYRAGFFSALKDRLGSKFELFGGDEYFEPSVKSERYIRTHPIKNHYFLNRKLLFQAGIWHLILSDDLVVMELNPRIINNWIFLVFRKILGLKTILWGHAWPRKGKNSKSDWLRNLMRQLATIIVVYTEKQRRELQEHMPGKRILAAPNALLSTKEMLAAPAEENPLNLLYVGRLTKAKKPFFMVKAFFESLNEIPAEVKLFIAGEGEERERIEKFIEKHNLSERVILKGHVSDYEQLKSLYSEAIFSVSPGYGGLSITQSFGFGVPILISKNENHSPEIEAVDPNENAIFYETDNLESFKLQLKKIYEQKNEWLDRRNSIAKFCKKSYSVEAMAGVFIKIAEDYET